MSLEEGYFRNVLFESIARPPISQNRINIVVKAAVSYISSPKVVTSELEALIMNNDSNPAFKLPCLYIIDALCKYKVCSTE
jgi:hypothetical protein